MQDQIGGLINPLIVEVIAWSHDQPDDRGPADDFEQSVGIRARSDLASSHRLREARTHGGEHAVFEPSHDEFVELRVGPDLGEKSWQSGPCNRVGEHPP